MQYLCQNVNSGMLTARALCLTYELRWCLINLQVCVDTLRIMSPHAAMLNSANMEAMRKVETVI